MLMENNFLLKISGLNSEQLLDICIKSFPEGEEVFEELVMDRSEVFLGDDTIDIVFDGVKSRHCIGNTNDKKFQSYITSLEIYSMLRGVNVVTRTYEQFIQDIEEMLREQEND